MNGTAVGARWVAVDVLRGATIAAMILVNNPGDWGHIYAPLRHADWHGCTPTDLIFPTFLFVAGVAIVPALTRALQRGATPGSLVPRVLRRTVYLVLLGMLLSAFPVFTLTPEFGLHDKFWNVRFPGVLQRIGVCYGATALLFLFTTVRTQRVVGVLCLLVYWPLLCLVPSPDGTIDIGSQGQHLAGWLDRTLFGNHIWVKGKYDPEGLLSTIPALATIWLGVEAGRVLQSGGDAASLQRTLLLRGAVLTAGGVVWGWFFPVNKALWTSSYALYTGGLATTALGVCLWLSVLPRAAPWLRPCQVYGRNALLVFVGSGILGRIVSSLWTVADGESRVSLRVWLYRDLFAAHFDAELASLLFALCWVALWYAVLAWLYRRNIVWKV